MESPNLQNPIQCNQVGSSTGTVPLCVVICLTVCGLLRLTVHVHYRVISFGFQKLITESGVWFTKPRSWVHEQHRGLVGRELCHGTVRSIGGVLCPRRVVGDGFMFLFSKNKCGMEEFCLRNTLKYQSKRPSLIST